MDLFDRFIARLSLEPAIVAYVIIVALIISECATNSILILGFPEVYLAIYVLKVLSFLSVVLLKVLFGVADLLKVSENLLTPQPTNSGD